MPILTTGARSIRGAMGTYTWVATLCTAGLALLLWLGPCPRPAPAMVMEPTQSAVSAKFVRTAGWTSSA